MGVVREGGRDRTGREWGRRQAGGEPCKKCDIGAKRRKDIIRVWGRKGHRNKMGDRM